MDDRLAPRPTAIEVVAAVLAIVCLGALGLALVGEIALLRTRPRADRQRAWRLFGLTALTAALVAALLGGVVGVVRGLDYPPTVFFAFLEGGVIGGVAGLLLGTAVGAVLAVDLRRQASSV